MGPLRLLGMALATLVVLCAAGPVAAATQRVPLSGVDRELPGGLALLFEIPAGYAPDGGDGDSGSLRGPPYASEVGDLGSQATLDWSVTVERATSLAAVPGATLIHGWATVATGVRAVARTGRGVEGRSLSAPWVLTRGDGLAGTARHEAALALPLAAGRAVVLRLAALTPSGDVAGGGFGRFFVQGPGGPVAPSEWNRAQLEAIIAGVRIEGSLPPGALRAQRLGDLVRVVVTDVAGDPVGGVLVRAEARRAGAWRPVGSARTGLDGAVALDVAAARSRRVRLVAGTGRASVRSTPVTVPASDGTPYIVVLRDGAGPPAALARAQTRRLGRTPRAVFATALRGYAADLSAGQVRALRRDPAVRGVVRDRLIAAPETLAQLPVGAGVPAPPQRVPLGMRRIGATESRTAAIDGVDTRVDADVAVIDTGITRHPDLNVAGGENCGDGSDWDVADNGHGTHVAGIVGAKDNGIGVVGVAPGARIWSVRALGATGAGRWSWVICALDWVADHAAGAGGPIDVVNMSLGAPGSSVPCDDPNAFLDPVHLAVCRVVARGVTVVVSAGNDGRDLKRYIPATYPEVIAVTGLADYDGLPGGAGRGDAVVRHDACVHEEGDALTSYEQFFGPTTTAYEDDDDMLVVFNWPSSDEPHAIAAPAACVRSTWPGASYRKESGTSMAAPHVAGAVALLLAARRPGIRALGGLAALRAAGEPELERSSAPVVEPAPLLRNHFDDHDRHGEPALRVAGL